MKVSTAPIFITGTQRSGTTLLCRMLSVHPNIYIRNEIPGVRSVFAAGKSKNQIMAGMDHAMVAFFGMNLFDFLAEKNKSRWGLKDPELTQCLDHLVRAFPESKIIIIIRDGRAVANSYMKNMWGLGVNVYYGALRWQREVDTQVRFAASHEDCCRVVRFEDLIADHRKELQRICAFIGEPYAEVLDTYYEHDTEITKRRQSKNVFKKPDYRLTLKWQQDLSRYQINIFESVAASTLQQHGYALLGRQRKIPPLLRFWFYLQQTVVGEVQIQYQWRIKGYLRKLKNRRNKKLPKRWSGA